MTIKRKTLRERERGGRGRERGERNLWGENLSALYVGECVTTDESLLLSCEGEEKFATKSREKYFRKEDE